MQLFQRKSFFAMFGQFLLNRYGITVTENMKVKKLFASNEVETAKRRAWDYGGSSGARTGLRWV